MAAEYNAMPTRPPCPMFDRANPPAGSVDRREHRNTPPAYSPRVLYFAGRATVAELPVFAADCGLPLPIKVGAAIGRYGLQPRLSMQCESGLI